MKCFISYLMATVLTRGNDHFDNWLMLVFVMCVKRDDVVHTKLDTILL